jgi:hypothetical protein
MTSKPNSDLGWMNGLSLTGEPMTWREIYNFLFEIYGNDYASEGAFKGKIKHLRRLGVIEQRPGTGNKIKYNHVNVYYFCFCLELEHFGLPPLKAVNLLKRHRNGIYNAYVYAEPHETSPFSLDDDRRYIAVYPLGYDGNKLCMHITSESEIGRSIGRGAICFEVSTVAKKLGASQNERDAKTIKEARERYAAQTTPTANDIPE